MIGIHQAFSASYKEARVKFLEGAGTAGFQIESHPHPLPGRDGEELAMDVALSQVDGGAANAKKLLIVSSACHGVEGYCGSGVQTYATHDQEWLDYAKSKGVAVLYIHALNPYGFSHIRRTTHENVDLNRNFQDFSKALPDNPAYRALSPLMLPEVWPPDAANQAAVGGFIQTNGMQVYQAAVSRGQHEFPKGLFFGGTAPTWSNLTLRKVLCTHVARALDVAWIDLHTGLGPSGIGERIFASGDDAATFARAKQWWSGNGATPITSIYDGSSTSAFLTGLMWSAIPQECPQARYTGIAMEFGTQPMTEVSDALRAEHWLNVHPEAPPEQARQIKQRLKDAFYTDTDAWKGQIISQARQSMFQAVDGLSGG